MSNGNKTNDIYNKGLIQVIAESVGKKTNSVQKPVQNTGIEIQKVSIETPILNKVQPVVQIDYINNQPSVLNDVVVNEESLQEQELVKELNIEDIMENPLIQPEEQTVNESTDELLQDALDVLNNNETESKDLDTIESGYFKENTKLKALFSNFMTQESKNGQYLMIQDLDGDSMKFMKYIGVFSESNEIDIDFIENLEDLKLGDHVLFDIYNPLDNTKWLKKLKKSSRHFLLSIHQEIKDKGQESPEKVLQKNEIDEMVLGLSSKEVNMYKYSHILRIQADSEEELLSKIRNIELSFRTMDIEMVNFQYSQMEVHDIFGLRGSPSELKFKVDRSELPGIISTHNELSGVEFQLGNRGQVEDRIYNPITFFKFKQNDQKKGIMLGKDVFSNKVIVSDLWSSESKNTLVIAKTGSGKSYSQKIVMLRESLDGVKQIIIDPDGEYKPLTEVMNGKYIDIGFEKNETDKINPFDFSYPRNLTNKLGKEKVIELIKANDKDFIRDLTANYNIFIENNLKGFLSIILKNEKVKDDYYVELSHLLVSFFQTKGVSGNNINSLFQLTYKPVSLPDFYDFLGEVIEKEKDEITKRTYISMRKGLYSFGDKNGSNYSIFGKQKSGLNFDNHFMAFNFKNLGDSDSSLKQSVVYAFMSFIDQVFSARNTDRVKLTFEEATVFLNNIDLNNYVYEVYKRGRKYNLGITLIIQDIGALFPKLKGSSGELGEERGKSYIQNTANFFIFKQEHIGINDLKDSKKGLNLNIREVRFLENLLTLTKEDVVGMGILITGSKRETIKIVSEKYIHNYITTDPTELAKIHKDNNK